MLLPGSFGLPPVMTRAMNSAGTRPIAKRSHGPSSRLAALRWYNARPQDNMSDTRSDARTRRQRDARRIRGPATNPLDRCVPADRGRGRGPSHPMPMHRHNRSGAVSELLAVRSGVRLTHERDEWYRVAGRYPEDKVVPDLVFNRVPEAKAGKNRLHLDLRPQDRLPVARLQGLGARRPDVGQGPTSPGCDGRPGSSEFCFNR
jgi:hypothetical protein